MSNKVDHPPHYRSATGYEAIDVIEAWGLNFNLGNVIKYTCRAGLKGGDPLEASGLEEKTLEDLKKALWYIEREIRRVGGETGGKVPRIVQLPRDKDELVTRARDIS